MPLIPYAAAICCGLYAVELAPAMGDTCTNGWTIVDAVDVATAPVESSWRGSNLSHARAARCFRRMDLRTLASRGARKNFDGLMMTHLTMLLFRDDYPQDENGYCVFAVYIEVASDS